MQYCLALFLAGPQPEQTSRGMFVHQPRSRGSQLLGGKGKCWLQDVVSVGLSFLAQVECTQVGCWVTENSGNERAFRDKSVFTRLALQGFW